MTYNPGAYSDGHYYLVRESGTYHYVEHYDAGGVYLRTEYPTAKQAREVAAKYRRNQQAAAERGQPIPKGHGVRAVTETVTRSEL